MSIVKKMTSKEHLHEYRQSTEGKPAHERVYFFHAHIYYDASIPEEKEKMLKLQQRLQQDFSGDKHVSVHARQASLLRPIMLVCGLCAALVCCLEVRSVSARPVESGNRQCSCTVPSAVLWAYVQPYVKPITTLQEGPVGPHVKANLEVLFTRERFAHMICYLTFVAPKTFSTLVHELTADTVSLQPCKMSLLLACGTDTAEREQAAERLWLSSMLEHLQKPATGDTAWGLKQKCVANDRKGVC